MNKNPIILIDDDVDDLGFMQLAFTEMKVENQIVAFRDGSAFLEYMKTVSEKVFFILCDINMSKISGLELKKIIYNDDRLRIKCIPFIFLSTAQASDFVMKAYSYGVQGYFVKPDNLEGIKNMLRSIMDYWSHSQYPNM